MRDQGRPPASCGSELTRNIRREGFRSRSGLGHPRAPPMTRFERPVRWAILVATPEMQLRYPDESGSRDATGTDEGVGSGFDNMSPRAYAERWFTTSDDEADVQRWFRTKLVDQGWSLLSERPDFHRYIREGDEVIGVATFGNRVRVHFAVEGRWPDDPR